MEITIRFVGGPEDGKEYRSDSGDPNEAQLALGFYAGSEGGKVGSRCKGMSPATVAAILDAGITREGDVVRLKRPVPYTSHYYEVTANVEEDGRRIVTLSHGGRAD